MLGNAVFYYFTISKWRMEGDAFELLVPEPIWSLLSNVSVREDYYAVAIIGYA